MEVEESRAESGSEGRAQVPTLLPGTLHFLLGFKLFCILVLPCPSVSVLFFQAPQVFSSAVNLGVMCIRVGKIQRKERKISDIF